MDEDGFTQLPQRPRDRRQTRAQVLAQRKDPLFAAARAAYQTVPAKKLDGVLEYVWGETMHWLGKRENQQKTVEEIEAHFMARVSRDRELVRGQTST